MGHRSCDQHVSLHISCYHSVQVVRPEPNSNCKYLHGFSRNPIIISTECFDDLPDAAVAGSIPPRATLEYDYF